MTKIDTKIMKYPESVRQPGRYTIVAQKEANTRFGRTIILTVNNTKGEKYSLFVAYPPEISENSLLALLVRAFGDDVEQWLDRKIDVTKDKDGNRRVEPVVK